MKSSGTLSKDGSTARRLIGAVLPKKNAASALGTTPKATIVRNNLWDRRAFELALSLLQSAEQPREPAPAGSDAVQNRYIAAYTSSRVGLERVDSDPLASPGGA